MSGSLFSAGRGRRRSCSACFFLLLVLRVPVAFALGLACLPLLLPRAAARHDDARPGDLQRLQLLHPAGRAVLPADGQPDERGRHHRPAGGAVARPGRQLAGLARPDQRRAVGVLRRHLRLLDGRRREPEQDLHRCPDQGGLRPLLLDRHHRGVGGAGRHHPALDPDDRVGRPDLDLDRRALSRRRRARPADRRRPDGDGARLCRAARLSDLSARDASASSCARSGCRSRP